MAISKKRFLAFLLCLILLVPIMLSACDNGEGSENSPGGESVDNSGTSSTTTQRYVPNLDKNKYKGREFNILILDETFTTYYSREFVPIEGEVLNSEIINSAVLEKNDYIEETYGVTIKPQMASLTNSVPVLLETDFQSGTRAYDASMCYMVNAATLAKNGVLLDMAEYSDVIDFTAPWWDQASIEQLSIMDKIFFACGDITLLNKVCAIGITFNKTIVSENDLESPYDLVENKQWTWDKFIELAKKGAKEIDGVAGMSFNDQWGLSLSYGSAMNFFIGAGQHIASLNNERLPELTIDNNQSINVLTKILEDISDDSFRIYVQEMPTDGGFNIWEQAVNIFSEGRALFVPNAFSAIEKLRDSSVDFGIVPVPKFDEHQDEYYTFVATNTSVTGVVIPAMCADPEFSAYMVEVCAAEGKNYITPAYYDKVLMQQGTRDDESQPMLDIIFNNLVYDVGHVFRFGGTSSITTALDSLSKERATDIVSKIDSLRGAIEADIQETIDAYSKY